VTTRIVLVGAGGYAREVAALIEDVNLFVPGRYELVAFLLDERYEIESVPFPAPVIHTIDGYAGWDEVEAICCIGDPAARRAIVTRLADKRVRWATVTHPHFSRLGPGTTIGEGSVVDRYAGATVNVKIGRHVHINASSGFGHDSVVGDFVTVSAFANVTGRCVVEDDVFVGDHAVILPGLRVGRGAKVGAGSVVVRSVPAGATVFGNPAKRIDA
jgi:sugar O-acyltransferase (sialic acid O-acetyltransferase NeuD family)